MDRVENVMRLAACAGVGPRTYRRLIDAFGSAEEALGAPIAALERVEGVSRKAAEAIASCAAFDPEPELARAAERQVRILTQSDPEYPRQLRAIDDPPILLYVRGELRPTDAIAIAIVGTREPSSYGHAQARRFAVALVKAGFTVVSGLARGVDSSAHEGALGAQGRTIAVLGTGLGRIYPEENRDMAAEILHSGALVSEFPMDTGPSRENFPRRNRIIAGLSLGTLVIEAPVRSGALITARFANEVGREVFALPGPVDQLSSEGCNRLIASGQAKLVMSADDIFSEIRTVADALRIPPPQTGPSGVDHLVPPMRSGEETPALLRSQPKTGSTKAARRAPDAPPASAASSAGTTVSPALKEFPAGLNETEARIYTVVDATEKHIDAICADSGLPVHVVASGLMLLELKGRVRQCPGKFFIRR